MNSYSIFLFKDENICKTVIVSISQKWVCDNRTVQKLP